MQALALLALFASLALGAPSDSSSSSPSDLLARFNSYPDASCSTTSRRGTARVLRGENNQCRTFSAELALGAKAIKIVPADDDDDDEEEEGEQGDGEKKKKERDWTIDVYIYPFCQDDPVSVAADGVCLPAPGPGMHWMSYKLRLKEKRKPKV